MDLLHKEYTNGFHFRYICQTHGNDEVYTIIGNPTYIYHLNIKIDLTLYIHAKNTRFTSHCLRKLTTIYTTQTLVCVFKDSSKRYEINIALNKLIKALNPSYMIRYSYLFKKENQDCIIYKGWRLSIDPSNEFNMCEIFSESPS